MLLNTNKINDNSKTYQKQIHVYDGRVYAEIIYQDNKTDYDEYDLWYCSLHKSFGSFFVSSTVREKDLIAAHKWADEQLELLNKYTTTKLSKCNYIIEKELLNEKNS